ncbi:MAG: rod shape-determining protein MreC, partial [Firmicutes bacterium]|nr:rod shape-determining protein MreC [Bacillota bacterium]
LTVVMAVVIMMAATGVSAANPGDVSRLGGAVNGAVAAAGEPLSDAGSGISALFGGMLNIRNNQREINDLRQQVAQLETDLAEAVLTEADYVELRKIENSLGYVDYDDSYTKVTAKVVAAGSTDIFDTFTINAGEDSGIEKDDLVVDYQGIVGRVSDTGKGWSKVTGIVDPSVSISFTTMRDPSVVGVMTGDGKGGLSGYLFDDEKSVEDGDIIITSGMGYYPGGIKVATVDSVEINPNTRLKLIEAKPSADFDSVRIVTVLT